MRCVLSDPDLQKRESPKKSFVMAKELIETGGAFEPEKYQIAIGKLLSRFRPK